MKIEEQRRQRRYLAVWSGAGLLSAACFWAAASDATAAKPIRLTSHNLSRTGPSSLRSAAEPELCIFCHGAHGVSPVGPLWNKASSGVVYTPYSSSTLKAKVGQPTGSSTLCLSCHDGTIAMGKLRNRKSEVRMLSQASRKYGGRWNLGTDLSDDHPISFTYDNALADQSDGELRNPASLRAEVKLDGTRQLQCTTCHESHDNTYGHFLVMNNTGSALCVACHDKRYWSKSSHRTSGARWNGAAPNPWPYSGAGTVSEAGCESCHTSHKAGTPQRLLVFPKAEDNCLACHNGHVAGGNLVPELAKLSAHDVRATSVAHDPAEDLVNSRRHVACEDCHNPHASTAGSAEAPKAPGALAGVNGITDTGTTASPVTREYEVCFRCHADSAGKGKAHVVRDRPETNTRMEFNTGNASFHPVEGPGRNPDVPSILSPRRHGSIIYCTDCHNNDQGPRAGGKGPNGPHGSSFAPLLERKLELKDFQAESAASYALCYKCHSRDSILADRSFPFHRLHVVTARTACTTCHDSHGVADATHLINFNREYVSASSQGRLRWTDEGDLRGSCSLLCHGRDHDELKYDRNGARNTLPARTAAPKKPKKA